MTETPIKRRTLISPVERAERAADNAANAPLAIGHEVPADIDNEMPF